MTFTPNQLKMSYFFIVFSTLLWHNGLTLAQSNYASHANNIEYQGDGLPEEATLDGKVSKH